MSDQTNKAEAEKIELLARGEHMAEESDSAVIHGMNKEENDEVSMKQMEGVAGGSWLGDKINSIAEKDRALRKYQREHNCSPQMVGSKRYGMTDNEIAQGTPKSECEYFNR